MLFHNEPVVKTENVEVGFVCQYDSNGYNYLRKIMYAKNTSNLLLSNEEWENTTVQNLMTGEFKDIQKEMEYGIDLCKKIDRKNIKYIITSPTAAIKNGEIIIMEPIKVGSLLRILGFPEYLTQKELNHAKNILLNSSYPIETIKSSISLSELSKIDLLEAKETIEKLKHFKTDGNPSEITKMEKEVFTNILKSKK